jgi:hypothetical protein
MSGPGAFRLRQRVLLVSEPLGTAVLQGQGAAPIVPHRVERFAAILEAPAAARLVAERLLRIVAYPSRSRV